MFLEVLYWGDRRHLIKLEKIGRRLHWLVDGRFKRAPFLCFPPYINWRVFILKFLSKFQIMVLVYYLHTHFHRVEKPKGGPLEI